MLKTRKFARPREKTAVDDGWKIEMGLKADPEAAKKAAEEAAAAAPAKVELSSEAMAKIESAYVPASAGDDEGDALLKSAMATGDYSKLEEKWEAFTIKAVKPGEDDDDDDDDDGEFRFRFNNLFPILVLSEALIICMRGIKTRTKTRTMRMMMTTTSKESHAFLSGTIHKQ